MNEIACPHCKKVDTALIVVQSPYANDMGGLECNLCQFSWCYCQKHGIYDPPVPCPECKNESSFPSQKGFQKQSG